MAYLSDSVFDNGLSYITNNTENLYLLSADPELIWSNITTYAIGSKATPSISSPSDRTGGGREVIISAVTDGNGTSTGSATHFALTDDSNTEIIASNSLAIPISVTSGGSFETESFTVGIPDPA